MAGPLAKLIRSKYPGQYDDMTDEDLEKSILEKYPEYADLAKEDEVKPINNTPVTPTNIPAIQPEEPSTFDSIRKFWNEKIDTPITKQLGTIPQEARDLFSQQHPVLDFIGSTAESMLTPLNLGTGALFSGATALRSRLPKIAELMHNAGRATSIPVTAEGVESVFQGDTLPEKIGGGIQAILGGLGIRAKMPNIAKPSTNTPNIIKEGADTIDTNTGEVINSIINPTRHEKFPPGKLYDRYNQLMDKSLDGTLTGDELVEARKLDKILRNNDINPVNPDTGQPIAHHPDATKPAFKVTEEGKLLDSNSGKEVSSVREAGQTWLKSPKSVEDTVNESLKLPPKPKIQPIKENSTNFVLKNTSPETVKQLNEQGFVSTGRADKDGNPIFRKEVIDIQEESRTRQWYNLARGMMSVDAPFTTSAAFRQGLPWIGTRHWFNAYGKAVKSFGSEEIFKNVEDKIKKLPIFEKNKLNPDKPGTWLPSTSEEMGIKLVDASDVARGEAGQMRTNLAERIPIYGRYVRASNRAYAAFLNDLRANSSQSLFDDYVALNGKNPDTNTLKQIGEFVNTSTGLGKLSVEIGTKNYNKTLDFEKNAKLLSDVFFSPRLMARNIRMLNPSTYAQAEPFVRKQYTYALLRSIGAWWTMAGLAEMAGADISKDPTSSDFGKIKIGNTRLDPGGGLQQYLVLGSRYANQGTTPSTGKNEGKFKPFGTGFPQEDMFSTATEFGVNKLHPVAKFAVDLARSSKYPVAVGDRAVEMAIPLFTQDIFEILQEHPELAPIVMGASSLGMGSQTYGGNSESSIIPPKYDFVIGKRK